MTPAELTAAFVATHHRMGTSAPRRKVPRARLPTLVEADYATSLVGMVDAWRTAVGTLRDALPGMLAASRVRTDDAEQSRRARGLIDRARYTVTTSAKRATDVAQRAAIGAARHQKNELVRQMKAAFGVEVPIMDRALQPTIDHFVVENARLVEALGDRTLDEIEKLINASFTNGMTATALDAEIARRFEIAERQARLIARDQVSKLDATVTRKRHQEIGVTAFQWVTMADNRVRPSHAAMHDRVFRYDDPPRIMPGQEINCRCKEQPIFDEIQKGIPKRASVRGYSATNIRQRASVKGYRAV